MADDVTLDTKELDGLVKAFKGRLPSVRIGIMGSSAARSSGGANNAEIGAAHEYGTDKMPARSFLRKPLIDHLNKELESAGSFSPNALSEVIRGKDITPWLEGLAQVALKIVQGAFASGGYGEWAPWKHPEEREKNSNAGMLLVDTNQLRDSITTVIT